MLLSRNNRACYPRVGGSTSRPRVSKHTFRLIVYGIKNQIFKNYFTNAVVNGMTFVPRERETAMWFFFNIGLKYVDHNLYVTVK